MVSEPLVCYLFGRYVVNRWTISVVVFVHTHNREIERVIVVHTIAVT